MDLMDVSKNPYLRFKSKRGVSKIRQRLDEDEISRLSAKVFDDPVLDLSRDLFVYQILTGLAYEDLSRITWADVRSNGGELWIEGLRKKSGEYYSVYLVQDAVSLMEKHKGKKGEYLFAAPPLFTQNRTLKVVAAACGISKHLSSHVARHTAATSWIRHGVPLEVVRDMLGQTQIRTTEVYARLENESIRRAMQRISGG